MTRGNRRGAPRSSPLLTAVFHAIADCGDVVDQWDVAQRDDGVLLHLRSREQYPSEAAANEAADTIASRLKPNGFTLGDFTLAARADEGSPRRWRAVVEVLVS